MGRTTERATLSGMVFWSGLGMVAVGVAAIIGYWREPRVFRGDPPIMSALNQLRFMPVPVSGAPPEVYFALGKPFERTAYDLSQGKRLYGWFGCASCHAEGQGGKGPSFLDGDWIYGPSMMSIAGSIRDGRPGGMPSFGDRMTTDQIWQLAGYVRTIGAYSARVSAPARNDDRQTRPAENRAPAAILFNEGKAWRRPEGPVP
ncbi:Cytochrome C Class I [Agrobacterium tumefaciens]|uniref:c-type cytochrome n=1 Tax=Agrobacterium tumefaciens TaxID=358 RepID=UPI001BB5A1B8|nr:Cytochrome C Class I [Agrobacterium tumefaciens]